jgi:nitrous oxide reductase accessory protein NosL
MPSSQRPLLASFLLLALAACNQSASAPQPQPPQERTSASYVTPQGFRLPEGAGCSGDIARFRAVQDNDLSTGHVNQSVYNRIKVEVDQAAAQCSAGNDAGARGQLAATKRRFGYPG